MNIDGVTTGIVLDHIQAGKSMEIYKLLELDQLECSVAIIQNAVSTKYGRKDIIKIDEQIGNVDFFIQEAFAVSPVGHQACHNCLQTGDLYFVTVPAVSPFPFARFSHLEASPFFSASAFASSSSLR